MKVAAANYPIGAPRDFTAFADKQAQLVAEAAPSSEKVQPVTVASLVVRSAEPPALAACNSAMLP